MQIRNRIMEQRLVHPDEVAPNPRNWRVHPQHQRDALRGVLAEVGIVAPVIAYHSERAGGQLMLVDGHERMTIGVPFPCVILDVSDSEADKLLATFDPITSLATANAKALEELVASFELESPAVSGMLDALLAAAPLADVGLAIPEPPRLTSKDKRKPCVDVIYTFGGGGSTCCVAYHSGLMYGVRSTDRACTAHPVAFIDNEFKGYDHEVHKAVVARHQPKYATVMDIFTPEQSRALGIEHHGFERVMRWAEDLSNYTQNVIIIPKYDCIADIPEHFMLGYSVPSSYGGTPLPVERFSGRRVHLLGGSPKKQYTYWSAIPDSVVSVDTNYIHLVSTFGKIQDVGLMNEMLGTQIPAQAERSLASIGFGGLPNPLYVAFAINAGYYLALFSNPPIPPVLADDVLELMEVDDA